MATYKQEILELKAEIGKLQAENFELRTDALDHAEYVEAIEVRLRKIKKHNSDLKGEIRNNFKHSQDHIRDLIRYAKLLGE